MNNKNENLQINFEAVEDNQENLELIKSFSFNFLPVVREENSLRKASTVSLKAEKVPFLSQCEPQQVDDVTEEDQND